MDLSNFVTCQMADHIILRNKMFKEELSRRCKVSMEKITCLELWRDFPIYSKPKNTGILLCFGRIRKYKGFDKLLQIVTATPEVSYRVVGEPDEESRPLVEQLKRCANAVVIDREVSDQEMVQEFKNADWLVLPYTTATQSGVIVDAFLHARPVIAFDVGAISEQVVDGLNGRLVKENDVDGFVRAIREVRQYSPEYLNAYSEGAYRFAYERYSAEAAAEKFLEVVMRQTSKMPV